MQQWQRVKIRTGKREEILKATENKGQEGGKRGERSRAEGSGITMYSIYSILSSSIAEDNRKICATTKLHSTEKQSWHEKLSLSVKHTHMHACTRPHAHTHQYTTQNNTHRKGNDRSANGESERMVTQEEESTETDGREHDPKTQLSSSTTAGGTGLGSGLVFGVGGSQLNLSCRGN